MDAAQNTDEIEYKYFRLLARCLCGSEDNQITEIRVTSSEDLRVIYVCRKCEKQFCVIHDIADLLMQSAELKDTSPGSYVSSTLNT